MQCTVDKLLGRLREKDIFTPGISYSIKYGYLYNWYAATSANSLPSSDDWQVPTAADFNALIATLGGAAAARTKLAETGNTYWVPQYLGRTNESNFNARGSGRISSDGSGFGVLQLYTWFWTKDSFNGADGVFFRLSFDWPTFYTDHNSKSNGFSIRLVRITTLLTEGQTDIYVGNDGKMYPTICIGGVEWMACNLAETIYRFNGTIPEVTDSAAWAALITGARCSYDNNETNAFTLQGGMKAIKVDKILGRIRQNSKGLAPGMYDLLLGRYRENDFKLPINALLDENGNPILDESGNYILIES